MRFLGNEAEGRSIMPLNFIYDNPKDGDDTIMIVYKDINTGEKFVKNIAKPEIVIYIVKEQYRGKTPTIEEPLNFSGSYRADFFKKEQCDAIRCRYRSRKYVAAKKLGIPVEDVDTNPFVAGTDVKIEHWYFVEFLHEYSNDLPKPLTVGYFDIEADTRGYATSELSYNYGKFPITVVTYISDARHQVYVFIIDNPEYGRMQEIKDNLDKMKKEMKDRFDPLYGENEYNLVIFENEIDLIAAFWRLVNVLEDDFALAWNAPFDVGNLSKRPYVLGYDPRDIICSKKCDAKVINFKEDKDTFVVHKKKHIMKFGIPTIIEDFMRMYAGIRSARGKIPSFALDFIAQREGVGHKDTYEGTINEFLLRDFWNYIVYNVNDVWTMVAINRKVNDTSDVYSRMLESAVTSDQVFTSTTIWAQFIKNDLEANLDRVLCNNRNKNTSATQEIIELGYDSDVIDANEDTGDDEEINDEELKQILDNIADQQSLIDKKTGKKKKFNGALVLNTARSRYTGTKINGVKNNYVHRNTIDMDITAEYPTAISIMNASNDTFVGKVYIDHPEEIDLPFYNQYEFVNKAEAADYKMNKAALMLETALQGNFMLTGEIAFGLPDIVELNKLMEEEMKNV